MKRLQMFKKAMMAMLWIGVIFILPLIKANPVRICVPKSLSSSCSQMERDLPETFKCVVAPDISKCIEKVHLKEADIVNVDPAGFYLAAKFYNLRPIATELVDGDPFRYQAIALVRKESDIQSAEDLRNRRSCHTGMRRTAGWQIPVGRLLSSSIMPTDCEEGELASVADFFNGSCVPGDWSSDPIVNQGLKSRYSKLCSRCKNPSTCAKDDAYAGYEGVMHCLSDGAADVAFTKISALRKYLEKHPDFAEKAEILCFEGGRKSVEDPSPCVWGKRPTNAFVASESEEDTGLAALLQTQAQISANAPNIPEWYHKTFLSHPEVTGLRRTEDERRSLEGYLGSFIDTIQKPSQVCEFTREDKAIFCVTSDEELKKCNTYARAALARGLWPHIKCYKTESQVMCMSMLLRGNSHLLVLDGGDAYKAGRYYDLDPIASEIYNDSDASYYAVAVIKSTSNATKISQLRGLRSCHTGIGKTAGWVMPLGYMSSQGLLPSDDACKRVESLADFFSEGSCVPGANDTKFNPGRIRSEDLCRQCIGDVTGEHRCERNSNEQYSGYAGALRCLSEGKGDVAFVKHTTVSDYTDGHSKLPWTENLISSEFKLLCDKTNSEDVANYQECNLGKVPSHQVVARRNLSEARRLHLARLLADSSRFFSADSSFYQLFGASVAPDLLFKDSATGLKVTPLDGDYEDALGQRFIEASRSADLKSCALSNVETR